jgi:replicative DNA helicase
MTTEHSDRAERELLGGLLRDANFAGLDDIASQVRIADFRIDAHQRIYSAILSLWDTNKPVSVATIAEVLHSRGDLHELGDGKEAVAYLSQLMENQPTGGEARFFADSVHSYGLYRALAQAGRATVTSAENPVGSAEEAVEEAEKRIFALAERGVADGVHDAAKVVGEVYDRLDKRTQGCADSCGVPTGFSSLDEILTGLPASELIVLAARPSVGKTSLAIGLARNVAVERQDAVLFVSLEQARAELFDRLLCSIAGIDGQRLRRGELTEKETLDFKAAGDEVRQSPLFISDAPAQRMLRIAANARRLKRRKKLKLLIVDYLQLIEPDDRKVPRHEQVGGITRRLKGLARELSIPVVALAQLNRETERRIDPKPKLSDLRDSGEIEQHADTVLLLHKPELKEKEPGESEKKDLLMVRVAKQRNGPTGDLTLRYERQYLRFTDPADDRPFRGN